MLEPSNPARLDEIPVVLIVNRDPGTLMLLQSVVQEAGLAAITLNEATLNDEDQLPAFIEAHRPHVVLYDIPWPYDRNLARFQAFLTAEYQPRAGWVALTTSVTVAETLNAEGQCVGLGKPFDLEQVMNEVGRLLRAL